MENDNNNPNRVYRWRPPVLVATDDPGIELALGIELSSEFEIVCASTYADAADALDTYPQTCAVMCGYELGETAGGIKLLTKARAWAPNAIRALVAARKHAFAASQAQTSNLAQLIVSSPWGPGHALSALRARLQSSALSCVSERRLTERLAAQHLAVQVRSPVGPRWPGRAINLSRGGILLDLEYDAPAVGDVIQVSFLLPNWPRIPLELKVLRATPGDKTNHYRVAGTFQNLDGNDLTALDVSLAAARRGHGGDTSLAKTR